MGLTRVNVGRMEQGLGEGQEQNGLTLTSQGWTDTEAAAMWGAAQQVSGPPPCSQGLEDVETKTPPKFQGREAEDPRKVTRDTGHGAQGVARRAGVVLGAPAFPCPPGGPESLRLPEALSRPEGVCDCD